MSREQKTTTSKGIPILPTGRVKADNSICIYVVRPDVLSGQNYRLSIRYMKKVREAEDPLRAVIEYVRSLVPNVKVYPDEIKGFVRVTFDEAKPDEGKYLILKLRKILGDTKNEYCQLASSFYEDSNGELRSKQKL